MPYHRKNRRSAISPSPEVENEMTSRAKHGFKTRGMARRVLTRKPPTKGRRMGKISTRHGGNYDY